MDNCFLYVINHISNSKDLIDKLYYNSSKNELNWLAAVHGYPSFLAKQMVRNS
jgi:hypothetical protein